MLVWYLLIAWLLSQIYLSIAGQNYLDFAGNGTKNTVKGNLPSGLDYAILGNDSKGNFPEQFAVCSSVYNSHFVTTQSFFQLMQEDGSPWITFNHWIMKFDENPTKENAHQKFHPIMFIDKKYVELWQGYFFDFSAG